MLLSLLPLAKERGIFEEQEICFKESHKLYSHATCCIVLVANKVSGSPTYKVLFHKCIKK